MATVSGIDKMIGLFCRIQSLLQGSFAKETYNFIDATNRSQPMRELIGTRGLSCDSRLLTKDTWRVASEVLPL